MFIPRSRLSIFLIACLCATATIFVYAWIKYESVETVRDQLQQLKERRASIAEVKTWIEGKGNTWIDRFGDNQAYHIGCNIDPTRLRRSIILIDIEFAADGIMKSFQVHELSVPL